MIENLARKITFESIYPETKTPCSQAGEIDGFVLARKRATITGVFSNSQYTERAIDDVMETRHVTQDMAEMIVAKRRLTDFPKSRELVNKKPQVDLPVPDVRYAGTDGKVSIERAYACVSGDLNNVLDAILSYFNPNNPGRVAAEEKMAAIGRLRGGGISSLAQRGKLAIENTKAVVEMLAGKGITNDSEQSGREARRRLVEHLKNTVRTGQLPEKLPFKDAWKILGESLHVYVTALENGGLEDSDIVEEAVFIDIIFRKEMIEDLLGIKGSWPISWNEIGRKGMTNLSLVGVGNKVRTTITGENSKDLDQAVKIVEQREPGSLKARALRLFVRSAQEYGIDCPSGEARHAYCKKIGIEEILNIWANTF